VSRRRILRASRAAVLATVVAGVVATTALAQQADKASGGQDQVTARLLAPGGEFTVGDPVEMILEVIHPAGAVVDPPEVEALQPAPAAGEGGAQEPDTSFALEEIAPAPPREGDTRAPLPAGRARTAWRVVIRPFAPGAILIPSLTVAARLPGGAVVNATTEAVTVTVKSVLHDAEEAPAGIKGPWTIPANLTLLLLVILAALAAAIVALLLWRRWRAKRRPVAAPRAVPAVFDPAWARALRDLEKLLGSRMIEEGRIKEFHVALAEIVKRFLGEQHAFDALDRTSEEVLGDLRRRRAPSDLIERTDGFLVRCDLVKFAKHWPERPAIDETVREARALIETGRTTVRDVAAA